MLSLSSCTKSYFGIDRSICWELLFYIIGQILKNPNSERIMVRIQSIDRAVAILNLFKSSRSAMSLGEIAAGMGMAKTTIHTIVKTLEHHGLLNQDAHTKKYTLGFTLYELGMLQASNLEINRIASRPIHILANDTGSYCRVALWDSGTVFVTLTVHPYGKESPSRQIGPRLPAYCTALGKAMLAHMPDRMIEAFFEETELAAYTPYSITDKDALVKDLEKTRKRGYSISNRETLIHQIGVAAPIFSEKGNVIAAASVQLDPENTTESVIDKKASRLLRTTYEISSELGYVPVSLSR